MTSSIEIHGLDEIIRRMQAFPEKLKADLENTMRSALLTLWENVPPYPTVDNPVRKGTLGRTLGSSEAGGKSGGQPEIYEVHEMGSGFMGRFGTNLEYAPYVIGDEDQAWMHYLWWRMKDIAAASEAAIREKFNTLAEHLATFLEGKGQ